MKKPIFLLTTILFLVILPAVFVCRGISFSEDFLEVETKIENLQEENKLLEKELVQKSSSAVIYSEVVAHDYAVALKR
ncbi:hypothetical protein COS55_03845 [Candidatus Shapirobacteria bacterium CG03_land_8_20_14_0_80_40_19]|uniref:Cell division protein FtsL n=4 Tax=Candidatus Shapironibacteriota TaxID=1752721 RepID=A0A2M7BB20_9BACT|nr:MAG: hypothetical protein COV89_01865 [Candidatus Shapirobacteria bacterium CG11_big_fil_rev_8_21_14_0_20_40_12]PIV00304.1 MAG: hypothetical protein COS55_03845 [Candidatus Shapirobacteria bacterium CG03_land_8_20_14_0_80_40_19]PJC28699.1 MAG: hypothetical protein CO053_03135 [Candidatus Shapirobacteria bacterium CG_4_9_14_0_2_um_filter_40_11]PJC76075.1 MAG: hypothetical protein CO010_03650 [Candidatus Shapirobacteria bacterium CG_4_8_14_3_um_filter_39_11]